VKLKAHRIYLFTLKNGKKRIGYGDDPEHARRVLSYRMTSAEMDEMTDDPPETIRQQELQQHVHELG